MTKLVPLSVSLAITFFVLEVAAIAEQQNPAPATDQEKKVCRSSVKTGSIMRARICRTKAEWEAIDQASEQDTQRKLDDRRLTTPAT